MKTVAFATLGCKTNQFESAAMEGRLREAGYRTVPFEEGADLVVVNTCTVTAATDAQSRNLIRRARRMNARARVVVTGCYAQVDPAALQALPGVSLVLGNDEKSRLLEHLAAEGEGSVHVSDIRRSASAEVPPLSSFSERSRAFLQIQNGCDAFCSYCIIPYARGRSRSVPPSQVVEQVRQLAASGHPEIVLTGIHIGGYGTDLPEPLSLLALLRRIEAETSVRRLRLGSVEPTEIPDELIDHIAGSPILCPHLHIPLQAGDDGVLQRMNRHYSAAFFQERVERIRQRLPEAAIGLDVITGFPGETESEHENTLRFLERLPITHLHVFPFSRRPGTPADTMPDQLPGDRIRERAAQLRAVGEAKNRDFARAFIGRKLEIVVEGHGDRGLSRNYLSVRVPGAALTPGTLRTVCATSWSPEGLLGEPA